jgi:hypothetical protein
MHVGLPIVVTENQQVLLILSVFVALDIQHTKCMCHIILLYATPLDLKYFPTTPYKRHDLRKRVTGHTCFNFLYNFCLNHFSF